MNSKNTTSMIPISYNDRRHALIKHTLLRKYLEILFTIIGRKQSTIWYVDCFAGPWQIEDNDSSLNGTSISLSVEIMKKCHDTLMKVHNKKVIFKALYIEKDPESYERLKSYLSSIKYSNIHLYSLHGEFINLRKKILDTIGYNDFVFFFIDPKGWKEAIEIPTLLPLLKRNNCEFLINFMYIFINRNYSADIFKKRLKAVFGSEPKDCSNLDPDEREKYLINKYRMNLKSAILTNKEVKTAYVSILDPEKDRTKYHLVYVTRHPLGIVKFFEVSEKIELVQNIVREQTKRERIIEKTKQLELFPPTANIIDKDKPYTLNDIKEQLLNTIQSSPTQFGINEIALILEKKGWFISEIQKAFMQLEEDGKVQNLDAKAKRKKHPIHFENNNNRGELLIKLN